MTSAAPMSTMSTPAPAPSVGNCRRVCPSSSDGCPGYREALAGNSDATEIAGWIAETQRERDDVRYLLESTAPTDELSRDEARELVESFEYVNRVIADADPADKAALYKELGIDLTYEPNGRILVEARPRRLSVCVGGTRGPDIPRLRLSAELLL